MITVTQRVDAASVLQMATALRARYPFLSVLPAGKSPGGRIIPALQIGCARDPVLFLGGFGGEESITALVLLRFCENLCRTLASGGRLAGIHIRRGIAGRSLCIVPLLDPDGADARCHGIRSCTSHPALKAVESLCRQVAFRHTLCLRTHGESIAHLPCEPASPRCEQMARILCAASGYTAAAPAIGDLAARFTATGDHPAFTVRIGRGPSPLPFGMLEELYAAAEEMLVLAALM